MWKYNKQSGFTLVELAIVLVIIGLILAAVLKGQEMMSNAKVKNVINELKGIATAYYAYEDRYKAIPGDDINATAHLGQTAIAGGGDGILNGTFKDNAGTPATESQLFWQHTRLAGFMTGAATATTAPVGTNSFGGILGVQSDIASQAAPGTSTPVLGLLGNVVCSGNIPWKIAQAVDIVMDDGNSDTGTVRAGTLKTANATPETTAQLVYGTTSGVPNPGTMDETHTMCMKL